MECGLGNGPDAPWSADGAVHTGQQHKSCAEINSNLKGTLGTLQDSRGPAPRELPLDLLGRGLPRL